MKSLLFLSLFLIGTQLYSQQPAPYPPHPLRYDTILHENYLKQLNNLKNKELELMHSLLQSIEDTTLRPVTRSKLILLLAEMDHPEINSYLLDNITLFIPALEDFKLEAFPCYLALINKKSFSVMPQLIEYLKVCRERNELRMVADLIKTYIRTLNLDPNWIEVQKKFVSLESCAFQNYEKINIRLTPR